MLPSTFIPHFLFFLSFIFIVSISLSLSLTTCTSHLPFFGIISLLPLCYLFLFTIMFLLSQRRKEVALKSNQSNLINFLLFLFLPLLLFLSLFLSHRIVSNTKRPFRCTSWKSSSWSNWSKKNSYDGGNFLFIHFLSLSHSWRREIGRSFSLLPTILFPPFNNNHYQSWFGTNHHSTYSHPCENISLLVFFLSHLPSVSLSLFISLSISLYFSLSFSLSVSPKKSDLF